MKGGHSDWVAVASSWAASYPASIDGRLRRNKIAPATRPFRRRAVNPVGGASPTYPPRTRWPQMRSRARFVVIGGGTVPHAEHAAKLCSVRVSRRIDANPLPRGHGARCESPQSLYVSTDGFCILHQSAILYFGSCSGGWQRIAGLLLDRHHPGGGSGIEASCRSPSASFREVDDRTNDRSVARSGSEDGAAIADEPGRAWCDGGRGIR